MSSIKKKPLSVILEHPDARVHIDVLASGKRRISVKLLNKKIYIPYKHWITSYPMDLIALIMRIKGPLYLCDEIMRDEDQSYVQKELKRSILSYIKKDKFCNKRIMDFGCGCGASTIILAKMFPGSQIVGIDIERDFLLIAEKRAAFYDCKNVKFIQSASGMQLRKDIGEFEYIILSGVYEHMLPDERNTMIPQVWSILKPEGILFINQTPLKYYFIESHTTGFPLLNYFPDKVVLAIVRRFSKRVNKDISWNELIRKGIRGGSEQEIMSIIRQQCKDNPVLLEPNILGMHDRIDIWYSISAQKRLRIIKICLKCIYSIIKVLSRNIVFVPYLSLAIKKSADQRRIVGL